MAVSDSCRVAVVYSACGEETGAVTLLRGDDDGAGGELSESICDEASGDDVLSMIADDDYASYSTVSAESYSVSAYSV